MLRGSSCARRRRRMLSTRRSTRGLWPRCRTRRGERPMSTRGRRERGRGSLSCFILFLYFGSVDFVITYWDIFTVVYTYVQGCIQKNLLIQSNPLHAQNTCTNPRNECKITATKPHQCSPNNRTFHADLSKQSPSWYDQSVYTTVDVPYRCPSPSTQDSPSDDAYSDQDS